MPTAPRSAPLYHFASRVSTALVVPLAGLLIFAGPDILSVYRREAMAALPLLSILVAARAVEAIVGPASTIVEMIGHRALPLLNSLIAVAAVDRRSRPGWCPAQGALGMAIAVSRRDPRLDLCRRDRAADQRRPLAVRPQALPGARRSRSPASR